MKYLLRNASGNGEKDNVRWRPHTFGGIIFDRKTASIELELVLRVRNIGERDPLGELVSDLKLCHIALSSSLLDTVRY